MQRVVKSQITNVKSVNCILPSSGSWGKKKGNLECSSPRCVDISEKKLKTSSIHPWIAAKQHFINPQHLFHLNNLLDITEAHLGYFLWRVPLYHKGTYTCSGQVIAMKIMGLENHSEKNKIKSISYPSLVTNDNFSRMYAEYIWSLLSHTRQILTQLLPSHLIWIHLFSCMKLDQLLSLNTHPPNCRWKYPQGKADALVIDRKPWNTVCSTETKPGLS